MTRPAVQHDDLQVVVVPTWTLGDRLRKIRRTAGIGQREFAEMLGTNSKTYAAWELDNTSPRDVVALAKRIEILTGVPAGWTLGIASGPAESGATYHGKNGGNPLADVVDLHGRRHAATAVDQVAA